jgi:hypothetical protein
VAPTRITRAAVVLRVDRLCEDDRALVAELLDESVIACRKINVVMCVAAAGRTHVLGIE